MGIDLQDLLVLVIDCQTSGSSVEKSHLLELGWLPSRAADRAGPDDRSPSVRLLRPPAGWQMPPRVAKLTGIDSRMLEKGVTAEQAWRQLLESACRVAAVNGMPRCPAVIHYARFELGFLRKLAAQADAGQEFPVETICTHRIATRLLPTLPRKGLRAVAGFFGHSIGKRKRCLDHLLASAAIWRHLVRRLAADHGIATLDQLREWLQTPPPAEATRRIYPMPRQIRLNLPQAPGIYRMHRSNGDVLYIGKATNLRQRINSYFRAGGRHSESTLEMLSQAVDLQTAVTPSALEAALLESDEIKHRKPPYNIALSDDHRELFFLSRNFKHYATKPDDVCRIGPVCHLPPFLAAGAMERRLLADTSDIDTDDIPQLLAMPQRYCPDHACMLLGLDRFRDIYDELLHGPRILYGLLKVGRLSWIDKMNRHAVEMPGDDQPPPETKPEPFSWTPDAVAKSMTANLRHCSFLIRRARWLAILSESAVAWQVRDSRADQFNVMIINEGKIVKRGFSHRQHPLPVPPGVDTPLMRRRCNLDLPAYDRLRVLTTELRRLLSEKRPVCIRLNRRVYLYEEQLGRLMQWI